MVAAEAALAADVVGSVRAGTSAAVERASRAGSARASPSRSAASMRRGVAAPTGWLAISALVSSESNAAVAAITRPIAIAAKPSASAIAKTVRGEHAGERHGGTGQDREPLEQCGEQGRLVGAAQCRKAAQLQAARIVCRDRTPDRQTDDDRREAEDGVGDVGLDDWAWIVQPGDAREQREAGPQRQQQKRRDEAPEVQIRCGARRLG